MQLAALVTLPEGHAMRCAIPDFAKRLGLEVDYAMAAASAPVGSVPVIETTEEEQPEPDADARPSSEVYAEGAAGGLVAVLADALAATVEAFQVPTDLSAAAARRLLQARREAVDLLIADAPTRPGLTADALAWDVQRLRRRIRETYEEIAVPDRAKTAERAAKKASQAVAVQPAPLPPVQAPIAAETKQAAVLPGAAGQPEHGEVTAAVLADRSTVEQFAATFMPSGPIPVLPPVVDVRDWGRPFRGAPGRHLQLVTSTTHSPEDCPSCGRPQSLRRDVVGRPA